MKKNKYVKFNKSDFFEFWLNYFLINLSLFFIFLPEFDDVYISNRISSSLFVYVLIAITFFIYKLRVRRYRVINKSLSENQFKELCEAHLLISNQIVSKKTKNHYTSIANSGWHWDGVQFNLKRLKHTILVNTMSVPSIRSNPFCFNIRRKNMALLLELIEDIELGKDVLLKANKILNKNELNFWKQKEWGIISILKRLFIYSIFLTCLYFIFYTIKKPEAIILFVPLVLCGYFIFWDLMILLIKKDLRKKK